ncbi:pyrimidine-nucleoside phosphorylase [Caldicellulosiruptor changbaiensis]|uniref:Pyrimidine-nucleoside phosphorylase n=1 Tax=Caldicellulosiruptor changbaiensis TaxID=1222016 RepID=A0A3T0D6Y5_9FIRM|nr:pyrimidine-nucleoside phosphorylase [Caldicellulosiruptor changbaiensis]AZT90779.1 pyrimidine-nucleoside phosphorylase [Caldicellulosiruptor changbaiensis]
MLITEIIRKKRDGFELNKDELEFLINGYINDEIPDYQMAAFLMAVYFRGMSKEELTTFTMLMAQSGEMVDLSKIEGIKVDKHSSGGIADTTTLVLIPLAASVGVKVAKMSGRGLSHTGGTIDKLESIPGFRTELSKDEFIEAVNRVGAAIVGQSKDLVPADKKIYALRDVTATVESIPLIASSIMSKKIAAGADKIILDVKFGKGAFMKSYEDAKELANTMVEIGNLAGRGTVAYVTDMNQPLGLMIGNSLEVIEAIEVLKGRGHEDLRNLCIEFATEMMILSGIEKDRERAKERLIESIEKGWALKKFEEIIQNQGGNPEVVNDYSLLPQAKYVYELKCEEDLYIKDIDALKLGIAALKLGSGRQKKEDVIDYSVGIELFGKIGSKIEKGKPYARIYANDERKLNEVISDVEDAFTFSREYVEKRKVIFAKITKDGIYEM